jgi:sulfur carrier protein ThiS adenylyltransferase
MQTLVDRDIRQRDLVPAEKLRDTKVSVVGVGAIGRQVSLQLAAIGVGNLALFDHDTVDVENLAAQGFYENDLGDQKVLSVAHTCREINSEINVAATARKFRNLDVVEGVIFCCVDSIDTRKQIFEGTKNRFDLFIDGRMSAEFLRVFTVFDNKSKEYYATQLFPSSEAFQGSCTAKSTIYCANIAAGLMVAQFVKWLRGMHELGVLDHNIDFNILTNEVSIGE